MEEKMGLILKRKHIKSPANLKSGEQRSLMLFKSAIMFRHYTMLIHLWDNNSYLFTKDDYV
jgi:hypothetical protein